MTPEGKVKAKVVRVLKELGIYHFTPQTGGYGRSGIPDLICCYNSQFIGIECKAGKNKPTPLQESEMHRIRRAGGLTYVINEENVDQLKKELLDI
jgi:Holliday junction resolvase